MADDGTRIWRSTDSRGTRSIWARVEADGGLEISGQDLGPGVRVWGADFSEYEWWWTAPAAEAARILDVLGGRPGDDVIGLLRRWATEHAGQDPGIALQEAGIALDFHSRVGD